METKIEKNRSLETLHVLLIGNNPIEMGGVLEKLKQVRGQKIITEIAFDIKSILERLISFRPTLFSSMIISDVLNYWKRLILYLTTARRGISQLQF